MKKIFIGFALFLALVIFSITATSQEDIEEKANGSLHVGEDVFGDERLIEGDATESTEEVIILLEPDDENALAEDSPRKLFLHTKVRGRCAGIYARHEHEAYITRDTATGPQYPIDDITLHSWIGGHKKSKSCPNASWCYRKEKEYNLGCRRSCAQAVAKQEGFGTWRGDKACIW